MTTPTPQQADPQRKVNGEQMKYWVRENANGSVTLMRFDEESILGLHNSEWEFWCEIQALRQRCETLEKGITDAFNYANGRFDEWGDRAIAVRGILEAALAAKGDGR